jgi:hypothetical protein
LSEKVVAPSRGTKQILDLQSEHHLHLPFIDTALRFGRPREHFGCVLMQGGLMEVGKREYQRAGFA